MKSHLATRGASSPRPWDRRKTSERGCETNVDQRQLLGDGDGSPDTGGLKVSIVGEFAPTPFGFGKFTKGLHPSDY